MSNEEKVLKGVLYSAAEPSKEQRERFGRFLKNKYGQDVPVE